MEYENTHITVRTDGDLLDQVLMNYLSNAIRYNRPGGSAEVSLRKRGKYAVLTVRDTGIGIRREDLGQIFSRFYRADRSRSSEGTGLGLSMAAWIARVHGGSIRAESVYGEGSVFTAELPIEEQA